MPNLKISQLPETTVLSLTDQFAVVSSNQTKRVSFSNFQKEVVNYLVPTNLTVSADNNIDLDSASYNHSEVIRLTWSGANGNMSLTLPDATATNNVNRVMRFLSDTTFATNTRVYLTPAAGQTIDGSVNYYEINKEYEGIQLWSDGVEWFIIQKKA
tara:strand:+ start:1377 stop:1844 length:468 start_codon:yes stop_codon:yes gene_type:complete